MRQTRHGKTRASEPGHERAKPHRHVFDKKAFGKTRHTPMLPALMVAAAPLLFIILNGEPGVGWGEAILFLQMVLIGVELCVGFASRFSAKRSVIISARGIVVYRKRRAGLTAIYDRLAAGFGGHERVMYDVYVIDRADSVREKEKRPIVVRGDISVVSVYADGQTMHSRRQERRAAIPQYFTEAHIYAYELSRMAEAGYEPAGQPGLPERLEF